MERCPQELPNYIKWALWDLALDLLARAEWIAPQRFPAQHVLDWLKRFRAGLDSVIERTQDALPDCPTVVGAYEDSDPPISLDQLDAVLRGIRIGWYSNATQQFLDDELRNARRR